MIVKCLLKPGSKVEKIVKGENLYTVYVKARPKNGEANSAFLKLAAKYFSVNRAQIKIKSGLKSKHKLLEIN